MRNKPITGEIYHVYNRGVDKRTVFEDKQDHFRFIHDLFEFNDINPSISMGYYFRHTPLAIPAQSSEVQPPKIGRGRRKLLVDLMAFCLMPNHFHLMLRQRADGGISEFMRKIGTGYTLYFNQKYNRSGALFQGKYKYILIKQESHLLHLPYYIHFNPLDLAFPEWRGREIRSSKKAAKFLASYRWSSHMDYLGTKNFPSVIQKEFLSSLFEGPKNYAKDIEKWLHNLDLEEIGSVALEPLSSEVGHPKIGHPKIPR